MILSNCAALIPMTDYYPLLAWAVVKVDTADPAAREELYERARNVLVALRRQDPDISAASISREQAALQNAIFRLEVGLRQTSSRQNPDQGRSDFPASAPAPVPMFDTSKSEDELGGMPKRFAALVFGIAYVTAIASVSAVIYLGGLALVDADVMPYPVLVGIWAILGCIFVLVSRTIFRKLRIYGRSPAPART
jgi:hypothetical protein